MSVDDRTELSAPRARRWPWIVIGGATLIAVGAASAWAVLTVLSPAEDPLEAVGHTHVEVVQGEVGAAITLSSVAEWTPIPIGANRTAGVVTAVSVAQGDEVSQGAQLYAVDLQPVVIAEGQVPAFRPIAHGTEGPDVRQAQAMLAALGHYGGSIDGKAGKGTVAAIKAWQGKLGVEKTGVIDIGDVIFVPALPTRVSLDDTIVQRGLTLAGGEQVLRGLPAQPEFRLPVTDAQEAMIGTGTRLEITAPEGAIWIGFTADTLPDPNSTAVSLRLVGSDGASICAEQCGTIPAVGKTSMRSQIVTTETVAGLIVPSSALIMGADGQAAVISETGERVPVTVGASAKGMSIVTGIEEGAKVRVPAKNEGPQ